MKPTKCSVIRRKEKNMISMGNYTGRIGKMPSSLKRPDNQVATEAGGGLDNPQIHFQISEAATILVKGNIRIFLNRCLVPAPGDQDHAVQNSVGRIIRRNYIFPCVM